MWAFDKVSLGLPTQIKMTAAPGNVLGEKFFFLIAHCQRHMLVDQLRNFVERKGVAII